MPSLLDNVQRHIQANDNLGQSPIVQTAIDLVNNRSVSFEQKIPRVYSLLDEAHAAGGIERSRAPLILESLYALATEDELVALKGFEDGR